MIDRRRHVRRRTLLNGRIEIAKLKGWALDCAVRNLSDGGARLTLPDGIVVPDRVSLAISDQPGRPAQLVWYRDQQAGFALVVQHQPDRASSAGPGEDRPSARLAARIAAITNSSSGAGDPFYAPLNRDA